MEASHLESMVRGVPNLRVYYDKPNKPGVCKDAEVTRAYQFMMASVLMQGTLHFHQHAFTCTRERDIHSMLNVLQDQALRMHTETKKGNSNFQKDKVIITGKVGNKPDDLIVAVEMLLYWGRIYTLNVKS